MIPVLPENGYESPLPSPHGGHEFFIRPRLAKGQRLRVAYTRESVAATVDGGSRASQASSMNGTINGGEERNEELQSAEEESADESAVEEPRPVGFRDRIGCYTWTWFTMTMATGGIANVLHSIPYRSDWLRILGVVVFCFNLCLFFMNCTLLSLRFRWNPGSFLHSFLSPSESLFIPACVVS